MRRVFPLVLKLLAATRLVASPFHVAAEKVARSACVVCLSASLLIAGSIKASAEVAVPQEWAQLTPLQRTERVIQFGCGVDLINQLVGERVSITRRYKENDFEYRRYENAAAWVDFSGRWAVQTHRPGWAIVRRAGILDLSHFPQISFLRAAEKSFVAPFFLGTDPAARSGEDYHAITGEVAEATFRYKSGRLTTIMLDCSE
jgi:hypothetical protein